MEATDSEMLIAFDEYIAGLSGAEGNVYTVLRGLVATFRRCMFVNIVCKHFVTVKFYYYYYI